jgi:hypothetical protein
MTLWKAEFFLDNGYQYMYTDGDSDLGLDGVGTVAEKV